MKCFHCQGWWQAYQCIPVVRWIFYNFFPCFWSKRRNCVQHLSRWKLSRFVSEPKGLFSLTTEGAHFLPNIVGVMKHCQRECWASFVLNVDSAQLCGDEQHSNNPKRSTWLQFCHVVRYRLTPSPCWSLLAPVRMKAWDVLLQKMNSTIHLLQSYCVCSLKHTALTLFKLLLNYLNKSELMSF